MAERRMLARGIMEEDLLLSLSAKQQTDLIFPVFFHHTPSGATIAIISIR